MTSSRWTLSMKNPTPASAISSTSASLTRLIRPDLSNLSASCPARAEKMKKGNMKMPAAAVTISWPFMPSFSAST